ncbi:MAG: ABC transporter ATP-binding protein [Alphaproteobacteria bacterium]
MSEPLLVLQGLSVAYGGNAALEEVTLTVAAGEAVALLGANGAGKSTLVKAVMGLVAPSAGRMRFAGVDLRHLSTLARARLGLGYCPEGRRVFPGLSVRENLEVAARVDKTRRRRRLDAVLAVFPALAARADARAWQLSGGQQQMLALGRALMGRPRLLLLDEPSLGLSPLLADELLEKVREIAKAGAAVLLAEQNAAKALAVAGRAYLLEVGRVVREGASAVLAESEEVRKAFLGG